MGQVNVLWFGCHKANWRVWDVTAMCPRVHWHSACVGENRCFGNINCVFVLHRYFLPRSIRENTLKYLLCTRRKPSILLNHQQSLVSCCLHALFSPWAAFRALLCPQRPPGNWYNPWRWVARIDWGEKHTSMMREHLQNEIGMTVEQPTSLFFPGLQGRISKRTLRMLINSLDITCQDL